MQELQTFNFEELPVRTVEIENELYFVGKDIAEILGYARTDNA
ncbi:TPA: BRO family protein, partial [Staphylococcus aureus]